MTELKQKRASKRIAALLRQHLGVTVSPDEVGAFIRETWPTLAPLAHLAHGVPVDKSQGVNKTMVGAK